MKQKWKHLVWICLSLLHPCWNRNQNQQINKVPVGYLFAFAFMGFPPPFPDRLFATFFLLPTGFSTQTDNDKLWYTYLKLVLQRLDKCVCLSLTLCQLLPFPETPSSSSFAKITPCFPRDNIFSALGSSLALNWVHSLNEDKTAARVWVSELSHFRWMGLIS